MCRCDNVLIVKNILFFYLDLMLIFMIALVVKDSDKN